MDLRIENSVSLQATLRTIPAGLVSAGVMVSAVVLAATVLVWAARGSAQVVCGAGRARVCVGQTRHSTMRCFRAVTLTQKRSEPEH